MLKARAHSLPEGLNIWYAAALTTLLRRVSDSIIRLIKERIHRGAGWQQPVVAGA